MKNKIIMILIAIILIMAGILGFSYYKKSKAKKELKQEYEFVIKKFNQKSELVVADAEVSTKAKKTFTSSTTKDWPAWTEPFTKAVVSRTVQVEVPIKTEFKIVLKDLKRSDLIIKENIVKFKTPLIINVDSQIEGEMELIKSSNGIVDKAVDVFTSGKAAQEFLSEKSQDVVYSTSEYVMNDKKSIKKVIKYANEGLEGVLNLSSDKNLKVELTEKDIKFVNVDPKK